MKQSKSSKKSRGKQEEELVWYARGGNIAKMGPFKSQLEATNALRLTPNNAPVVFPDNSFVWPEVKK